MASEIRSTQRHDRAPCAIRTATTGIQHAEAESGVALLLTILALLLVSALGISALNRAADEHTSASTERRKITNVAAAEAALKLVESQLAAAQVGSAPASTPIDITSFVTESGGLSTRIRTGTIADGTPQPIIPIGTAPSGPGSDVRVGRGPGGVRLIYRVNVVASHPTGSNVQLQAQFSVKQ